MHTVHANRSQSTTLDHVGLRVTDDLLGRNIEITANGTDKVAVSIALGTDIDRPAAQALAAAVRSVIVAGRRFVDIREMQVPVSPDVLVNAYDADRADLNKVATQYRASRKLIDETFADAIKPAIAWRPAGRDTDGTTLASAEPTCAAASACW